MSVLPLFNQAVVKLGGSFCNTRLVCLYICVYMLSSSYSLSPASPFVVVVVVFVHLIGFAASLIRVSCPGEFGL